MALYDYPREKHPNITLTQFQRRAEDQEMGTLAMHWDGTYRDHGVYSNGFWTESDYANYGHPTSPRVFAKHLA